MRLTVRVYPGARVTAVGGRYGTTEPPVLIVRVSAPAVDGTANRATIRAVADAFNLPASSVRVVVGATQRTKILELDGVGADELSGVFGVE